MSANQRQIQDIAEQQGLSSFLVDAFGRLVAPDVLLLPEGDFEAVSAFSTI